jgi:SAM-dependent methyltransferase
MTACCETNRGEDKFSAFWERMARHYPLPFDEKTLADTERILSLAKARSVTIASTEVLDIGCGTGICTLPLAREAAMVTGLDTSGTMLDRLREVAAANGIQNVRTVNASWKGIEPAHMGFEKAFDIAWTSMTPAVQSRRDFAAMETCARRWCVYIGWGRKRENPLMGEIFEMHGLQFGPPPGVGAAHGLLKAAGRTPTLDYFETAWDWAGSIEEAAAEMQGFIELHGGRPQRDWIEAVLLRHERGGKVVHTTNVEEGIMVWPAP